MTKIKRANFIVGFNNWGKSTIIKTLFGNPNRNRFLSHICYQIPNFTPNGSSPYFKVMDPSNDDKDKQVKYLNDLTTRYKNNCNCNNYDLFGTMCPSMEQHNNFINILNDPFFNQFNEINLFLIEYKWECHAKLCINNIINSAKKVNTTKLNIYTINGCFKNNEAGPTLICNDIVNILNTIY